jgi:hypothetical protein
LIYRRESLKHLQVTIVARTSKATMSSWQRNSMILHISTRNRLVSLTSLPFHAILLGSDVHRTGKLIIMQSYVAPL